MTSKQIKEQAARYAKFVEWSDEDQCFISRCPELMGGGVHGNDEARVYKELCQTVEEWIEHSTRKVCRCPSLWARRNSAANLCSAWNRRCTAGLLRRPSPPAKASTAIA